MSLVASDEREKDEAFCASCPDHEACATGYPCATVKWIHGVPEG